jgi:flavin reductase (DIM6/NTAB) family NADH-FMN oxidoreductase RutF
MVEKDEFREALRHWASGVTVVTTRDNNGKQHGITVSAFASVSLEPPLVMVCVDKKTFSHYAFLESRLFVVNILSENQRYVSHQFAQPLEDKFAGIEFTHGIGKVPVLTGALANLECRLTLSYDGGDHTIFIGEIENLTVRSGKPLLYFHGHYGRFAEHFER